jgi:hypothetical protein
MIQSGRLDRRILSLWHEFKNECGRKPYVDGFFAAIPEQDKDGFRVVVDE